MVRAEVPVTGAAEVRRLVPAIPAVGQPVDDDLEVGLHRIGLARELVAVGVGEARSGLRFELVARQVLGPELERVRQVGLEIGGALAGDAVDEIEGDVVKSGITQMVERTPDGVRLDNTVENLQQPRAEALHAERHTIHPHARGACGRAPA